jgi:hypothetical protein
MAADVMGSPAWIEAGSFWVALIGVLFGLGALIVSIVLGMRSARAAEDSALQARASAEAAVAVAHAEQERYHEDHYPDENGTLAFHAATADPAGSELVFTFKLDRAFVVQAEASRDDGQAVKPLVVPPPEDEFHRVSIDSRPEAGDNFPWTHLTVRFWPPRQVTGRAKPWSCPCGRPGTPDDGMAHWEWVVRLDLPQDQARQAHFSW